MLEIGNITSVIIGRPYPKTLRRPDNEGRHAVFRTYERRVNQVIKHAKNKEINIEEAKFAGGEIIISNYRNNHGGWSEAV